MDWQQMFVPQGSILEPVVRGTIMYLALFAILRVAPTRQLGELSTADLLVVVLIADVSQNAFSSDYKSITEGLVLVITILIWNYFIDWLAFRFPSLTSILQGRRITLIENGIVRWDNLAKENMSKEELYSHLREQGVESETDVKLACIEISGRISVVKFPRSASD